MERGVVSADDLLTDGIYWLRPWDMTLFGDAGAAAMAASGYRYAWLWSSDHYDGTNGWADSSGIHLGWSNDPALPPKHGREIISAGIVIESVTYAQHETPWLVYAPEDASFPFRLYGHSVSLNTNRQNTLLYKSADLLTWTIVGVSHLANNGGHAGYQLVHREAADDYWSQGLNGTNAGANGYWTSSDGLTFTLDATVGGVTGDGLIYAGGSGAMALYSIAAQRYMLGFTDDGQRRIAVVPISDSCELPATADDIVDVSTGFASITGYYPGPKYLQGVDVAIEDGIAHIFPKRGFFSDQGLVAGASYANGGGYDDQISDYYAYIIDETAARASAPAGVRASASGGVVTLNWYNALPQNTYRVYRDTDPALGTKTLVGNVTGIQTTDTPGGTGTYYYQVVTLDGSDEEGARIVSPYVSSRTSLVNAHVTRVIADGGDVATIDLDHLEWAEDVLDELGITDDLLHWVMPEFGHVKDGSNIMSKAYCLGTTLRPIGGDLTFATANSTYSATAWDSLPAWTASTGTAQSYFGGPRYNTIRRARTTGLTLVGSIQKSHANTAYLFGWGQFSGYYLGNLSGTPGTCQVGIARAVSTYDTDTHGTTIANSTDHILGGVITSTSVKSYVEGLPGSGAARTVLTDNTDQLSGQKGSGGSTVNLLASGSSIGHANPTTDVRTFNNAGQFACRHLIVIKRALNDTQMATLNTRLRAGP